MKLSSRFLIGLLVVAGTTQAEDNYATDSAADRVTVPEETREEIEWRILNSILDGNQRGRNYGEIADDLIDDSLRRDAKRSVPKEQRIRDIAIDPFKSRGPFTIETHAGHTSTLALLDSHGNPWPLSGMPINSNPSAYSLSWNDTAPHIVVISVSQPYIETTMSMMLDGQTLPIVFRLKNSGGIQDALLTAKIAGLSPFSQSTVLANRPRANLSLETPSLARWVNGDIPDGAHSLSLSGNTESRAWRYQGMFILETEGRPVFPGDPFASESAPDTKAVVYAFKAIPDALAIQFDGGRPLVMRIM